jgi:hypothetical protein
MFGEENSNKMKNKFNDFVEEGEKEHAELKRMENDGKFKIQQTGDCGRYPAGNIGR